MLSDKETLGNAVDSLSSLIMSASNVNGYWLVDSISGVDAEQLARSSRADVIVANPNTRVEMVPSLITTEILSDAVGAVSSYVKAEVDNDPE